MTYSAADFVADVTELMCQWCPKKETCDENPEQLYWCVTALKNRPTPPEQM